MVSSTKDPEGKSIKYLNFQKNKKKKNYTASINLAKIITSSQDPYNITGLVVNPHLCTISNTVF